MIKSLLKNVRFTFGVHLPRGEKAVTFITNLSNPNDRVYFDPSGIPNQRFYTDAEASKIVVQEMHDMLVKINNWNVAHPFDAISVETQQEIQRILTRV